MPAEIGIATLVIAGATSLLAGAIASVAGFGIGSLLTPMLTPVIGPTLAVAMVLLPHAVGTSLRLARLRRHIDWGLLRGFGLASAAGGLVGAFLFGQAAGTALRIVFGILLLLSGLAGLTRWPERIRLRGAWALLAGAVGGLFGGLVGNQGSIRSAALLAFHLEPRAFVATATATALLVDAARLPFYAAKTGGDLLSRPTLLAVLCVGVVAGTLLGEPILRRIPETAFRRTVGILLLALGAYMLAAAR